MTKLRTADKSLCFVTTLNRTYNALPQDLLDATPPVNKHVDWTAKYSIATATALSLFTVVSSEISGEKFPKIYSNFSENFRKFVNYLCQSAVSKSNIAK